MNFYITAEELAKRKHINFSVDLDDDGLLISSSPYYANIHYFCFLNAYGAYSRISFGLAPAFCT